jgi:uncharacterized membrane protein YedE/YeeE
MKSGVYAFFIGVLFSLGLGISQMTNPSKVIGFLDITGNWDPSLAFVMGGALSIYLLGYKLILPRRSKPIDGGEFQIPTRKDIDAQLIIGSVVFGIGWALAGFCPGPGITAIVTGQEQVLTFAASMSVGVLIYHYIFVKKKFQDG